MPVAFLDTNILLEFQRLDSIDWLSELGCAQVTLVLAQVVLNELDDQAHDERRPRVKARAAEAIRYIESVIGDGVTGIVRPGVELRLIGAHPTFDLADRGLSKDVNDDWLIATALMVREQGHHVVIVTDDLVMRTKARTQTPPIQATKLDDKYRRKAEVDDEARERRRREQENGELRNASPNVGLAFIDGKDHVAVTIPPPVGAPSQRILEGLVSHEHEQVRVGLVILKRPGDPWGGEIGSPVDIDGHILSYSEYLKTGHERAAAVRRCVTLRLRLSNDGKAPADRLHLSLSFPAGLKLHAPKKAPRMVPPPSRPGGMAGRPQPAPWIEGIADQPRDYPGEDFVLPLGPSQAKNDAVELRYELPCLMHAIPRALEPIVVEFPSDADIQGFSLRYRLVMGNAPRPVDGSLHVKLALQPPVST